MCPYRPVQTWCWYRTKASCVRRDIWRGNGHVSGSIRQQGGATSGIIRQSMMSKFSSSCATGGHLFRYPPPTAPPPLRASGYQIGLDHCWLASWRQRRQKSFVECRPYIFLFTLCVYTQNARNFAENSKVMAKPWLGRFSGHNIHALDDLSHRDGRSKQ